MTGRPTVASDVSLQTTGSQAYKKKYNLKMCLLKINLILFDQKETFFI